MGEEAVTRRSEFLILTSQQVNAGTSFGVLVFAGSICYYAKN